MNNIKPQFNNQTNFTARINASDLQTNVRRWRKIARIFEEKTSTNPNESLDLIKTDLNEVDVFYTKSESGVSFCRLQQEQIKKLLEKTDNEVAEAFVKLMKVYKYHYQKIEYSVDFMKRIQQTDNNKFDADFANNFWMLILGKCRADFQQSLDKDSALKIFKKLLN